MMQSFPAAPISQNPFPLPHMWVTALEGCWGPQHQLAGTVPSSPISDGLVHSLDFPLSPQKDMTLEFQSQASIVPWEVVCGDVRSVKKTASMILAGTPPPPHYTHWSKGL